MQILRQRDAARNNQEPDGGVDREVPPVRGDGDVVATRRPRGQEGSIHSEHHAAASRVRGVNYKRKTKKALWTTVPGAFTEEAKQRKWLSRRSKVARAASACYGPDAADFIAEEVAAGKRCPVVAAVPELRDGEKYGWPISDRIVEVHHKYGRMGKLLTWKPGWIAVSKQGHRWIHSHITDARDYGWICPVGMWNDQKIVVASQAACA